jgi:hypothetical protein
MANTFATHITNKYKKKPVYVPENIGVRPEGNS